MFLFTKDAVLKKGRGFLSWRKVRIALATVLLSQTNLLLLDKATNHLDMPYIDIVRQVLQQYEGICLFVSHGRNFIQQVANKIWYIWNIYIYIKGIDISWQL